MLSICIFPITRSMRLIARSCGFLLISVGYNGSINPGEWENDHQWTHTHNSSNIHMYNICIVYTVMTTHNTYGQLHAITTYPQDVDHRMQHPAMPLAGSWRSSLSTASVEHLNWSQQVPRNEKRLMMVCDAANLQELAEYWLKGCKGMQKDAHMIFMPPYSPIVAGKLPMLVCDPMRSPVIPN